MAGWNQSGLPQDFRQGGVGLAKPAVALTWSELLRQTYALYRERFKTLFLISIPPATCAYFCFFLQRIIVRGLRAGGWVPDNVITYAVFLLAVALFEGAVYWIISGFFFAAIAANVLQDSDTGDAPFTRALSIARRRLGAVAVVALASWAPFAIGRTAFAFAINFLLERFGLPLKHPLLFDVGFTGVVLLLAGLISRLGLAIPAVVDSRGIPISRSLRLSIAKTENWEPFFMLFLAKTAILGYALYWALHFALAWVYQFALPTQDSRFGLRSIIYICLAAMLESPLFIAFTLLYQHSKVTQEEPRAAAAIH